MPITEALGILLGNSCSTFCTLERRASSDQRCEIGTVQARQLQHTSYLKPPSNTETLFAASPRTGRTTISTSRPTPPAPAGFWSDVHRDRLGLDRHRRCRCRKWPKDRTSAMDRWCESKDEFFTRSHEMLRFGRAPAPQNACPPQLGR